MYKIPVSHVPTALCCHGVATAPQCLLNYECLMYVGYVLVESTENSETLRFPKFISNIQFLTQFLKIVPSTNSLLYGIFLPFCSIYVHG